MFSALLLVASVSFPAASEGSATAVSISVHGTLICVGYRPDAASQRLCAAAKDGAERRALATKMAVPS